MLPKKLLFLFVVVVCTLFFATQVPFARADELDDINKQLSELTNALNQSIAATKPLESQLQSLTKQVEGIKNRVNGISADLTQKEKDINDGYKVMEKQQALFSRTVFWGAYY